MITLYGVPVHKGIAIAEAIVLSDDGGLDSLPADILRRGLESIRRGQRGDDLPAVITVCNSLDTALRTRIPGLAVAAIAAESSDEAFADFDFPGVIGVQNLLQSVEPGNIIIVDGNRGAVFIDPDAETVMYYQSMQEHKKTRRLFLESAHLPAVTQDGTTVLTLGLIGDISEASSALSEGADGLVLEETVLSALSDEDWARLLDQLAGKGLFLLGVPDADTVRTIVAGALPLQVTVAIPARNTDALAALRRSIDQASDELANEDVEPADIAFAVSADAADPYEDGYMAVPAYRVLVDARVCELANNQRDLAECVTSALSSAIPQDSAAADASDLVAQQVASTVLLASSIDSVRYLLTAGVDSVAVPPGLIAATKDLIRSIPAAE